MKTLNKIYQSINDHNLFKKEIVDKYINYVKNIQVFDIDILNLVFRSIKIQSKIFKELSKNYLVFGTQKELENFVYENIYYNMDKYYKIIRKPNNVLLNIYLLIFNYSFLCGVGVIAKQYSLTELC